MKKWLRRIGISLLVAILLLAVVSVVGIVVVDWDRYQGKVETLLSDAVGREVEIGNLEIEPGWTTVVRVNDVQVENPDWARAPLLLRAETAGIALRIWPLLFGQIEIAETFFRRPVLNLERAADGQRSWDLAAPAEAAGDVAAPESRDEFPALGRLTLDGGRVIYRDQSRKLVLEGRIETAKGGVGGGGRTTLQLEGQLEDRPLRFEFKGASIARLRETSDPYPFNLSIELGNTVVTAEGTVVEPLVMRKLDVRLVVAGPSLADVFPLFQIPVPATPPYRLEGGLKRQGEAWLFERFAGTVGDSDLAGWASVDYSRDKPLFEGEFRSRKLDLDDMAGLVGAAPYPNETRGLFPDRTVDLSRISAADANLSFVGEQIVSPGLPISGLRFDVRIKDSRAEFRPLVLDVAGGRVKGEVALNDRDDPPSADANLEFQGIGLRPFFHDSEFVQEMGGRFTGNFYMKGSGRSLKQIMGSADGDGGVLMEEGSLSGLLVEAVGLDVIEALALVIGEDDRVEIRCAAVEFEAEEGVLSLGTALIDTVDSVIVFAGNLDLATEQVDVQVETRAKDFSAIDLSAPVRVSGSILDPELTIGGIDPLSIVELGDQEDVDCDALADNISVTAPEARSR